MRELLWFAHTMLARMLVSERGEAGRASDDTNHGCPSGGIKSGFSTTIEP